MQESPTGSTEGEILRQWDKRIHDAGDPLAALADLLTSRQAARTRLFDLAGTTMLGCKLQRMLGAGGMGVTYAGLAPDGSPVAVKLVAAVAQTTGERFEQECRVLQTLRHDAIVRYRAHEVHEDGTGVLVMDRVDGIELELLLAKVASPTAEELDQVEPLAKLLREVDIQEHRKRGEDVRNSPRYRRRVLRLLAEVADGLHAAHAQGVIHRDVKPANILVRDDLTPVLIDFGLARDLRNKVSFTHSGVAMGTLAYMAPEQLGRDPGAVDRRVDVYALGLILYRALTGMELRQEVGDVIASGRRSFLLDGKQSRALPVNVQAILYSCLDPRPDHRYASAADLAADLRAAAGDGAVRAQRPNSLALAIRDRRKVAAVVAAAVLGASAFVWQSWPRGRYVQFASNVKSADVTVMVDGEQRAWLLDPIWLPYGEHTAQLEGKGVGPAATTFLVREARGTQWVALPSHYLLSAGEYAGSVEGAPVLFSTGHAWTQMAPGVGRDRRFFNGQEVDSLGPTGRWAIVAPGEVELRVVDGKGREERQRFTAGYGAVDVQMLPAWMSDIAGKYRRTWSTVLSPRMQDLELTTDAETWVGPPQESVFGFGTVPAACALVPAIADEPVRVRLRVRFPEPMRSAVVLARGMKQPGGQLDCEVAFEGQSPQVWPLQADGRLQQRVELRSDQPANWLEVTAKLSAGAAPSSSLVLTQMFAGVHGAGHWKDEPPCFAIVADPSEDARLPKTERESSLSALPAWTATPMLEAYSHSGHLVSLRRGPGEQAELIVCRSAGELDHSSLHRLSWPLLEPKGVIRPEQMHARSSGLDGVSFGQQHVMVDDANSDGWQDIVIGDPSGERNGAVHAGEVARFADPDGAPMWSWPKEMSVGPFGDDGSSVFSACGDWNGDGHEDLFVGAPHWWVTPSMPKSGRIAVVDGRTGVELWSMVGKRPYAHLIGLDARGQPGAPAALLYSSSWAASADAENGAAVYSIWIGGKDGREAPSLTMSDLSMAVLAPSLRGSAEPDLVLGRFGRWQDGFSGFERYEIVDGDLRLVHRQPCEAQPNRSAMYRIQALALVIDDVDGDGVADFAFPGLAVQRDVGVVFVSGALLQPIARAPLQCSVGYIGSWIEGIGSTPASLLVQSLDPNELPRQALRIIPGR